MGVLEKFSASLQEFFFKSFIEKFQIYHGSLQSNSKKILRSGSEEESEDEVAARPPAKKKGRGSMTQKLSQPKKIIYKDDISDESPSEPEEVDDDSDFGAPKKSPKKKAPTPKKSKKVVSKKKTPVKPAIKKSPAKKTPAKKTPAKKTPAKSAKKSHKWHFGQTQWSSNGSKELFLFK